MTKSVFPIFRLRIELTGTNPLVWREFWVYGDCSLNKLHHIIQAVMGWTDTHHYEFEHGGQRYAVPHPDDALSKNPPKDSRRANLAKILEPGDELEYVYDFGDNWCHQIKVLMREDIDQPPMSIAAVTAGERACPPEDVGGIGGYEEMLRLLNSNDLEDQEEADSWREWLDENFDANQFDARAINTTLIRMMVNKWGGK